MKPVRQTVLAPHWLDKKEQFALQRAIEKDLQVSKLRYPKRWVTRRRDASMVLFMLHTGLRLSEVASPGNTRCGNSRNAKDRCLVRHGKGNKERSVPLNAEVCGSLAGMAGGATEREEHFSLDRGGGGRQMKV